MTQRSSIGSNSMTYSILTIRWKTYCKLFSSLLQKHVSRADGVLLSKHVGAHFCYLTQSDCLALPTRQTLIRPGKDTRAVCRGADVRRMFSWQKKFQKVHWILRWKRNILAITTITLDYPRCLAAIQRKPSDFLSLAYWIVVCCLEDTTGSALEHTPG